MRLEDYRPETVEEIRNLDERLRMAQDLGAFALDMPDALDSVEKRREMNERLVDEQPDLADGIMKLLGRLSEIYLKGR
jgi:hypothetical protein